MIVFGSAVRFVFNEVLLKVSFVYVIMEGAYEGLGHGLGL
jgi:hypothetical protein